MLIDDLIKEGWLETPRIIEAFKKIKREDFIPGEMKGDSELNEPLSIGFDQTISQPLTVAFMLEKLQPEPGDKILDVGSGSGWTTALLADIVSQKENSKSQMPNSKNGKIIGVEIIPELVEFGRNNVSKYNYIKKGVAEIILGDGSMGYDKEAPYDKILASASATELPKEWKRQLKIGGKIVAPIGSSIWLFVKKGDNEFDEREFPGFVFVPLISRR